MGECFALEFIRVHQMFPILTCPNAVFRIKSAPYGNHADGLALLPFRPEGLPHRLSGMADRGFEMNGVGENIGS